jgi:hypothetical protein
VGACGGQYTANTMSSSPEALGMSLRAQGLNNDVGCPPNCATALRGALRERGVCEARSTRVGRWSTTGDSVDGGSSHPVAYCPVRNQKVLSRPKRGFRFSLCEFFLAAADYLLAPSIVGRYMLRRSAAPVRAAFFVPVPQRCPGKLVETPNLLKLLG